MTPKDRDKQFQIECLSADLIKMLMDDYHMSLEQAMATLYNSHTFEKIENEKTELYFQSAVYVMEYLQEELQNKSLTSE